MRARANQSTYLRHFPHGIGGDVLFAGLARLNGGLAHESVKSGDVRLVSSSWCAPCRDAGELGDGYSVTYSCMNSM